MAFAILEPSLIFGLLICGICAGSCGRTTGGTAVYDTGKGFKPSRLVAVMSNGALGRSSPSSIEEGCWKSDMAVPCKEP